MVTEAGLETGAQSVGMPVSRDDEDTEDTETRIREACEREDIPLAADILVRAYGPGIRGYLAAWLHSRWKGDEAFGMFTMDLLHGLAKFRWECTARSFGYVLAHRAACQFLKRERLYRDLPDKLLQELEAPERSRTASYLKTDFKERMRELRERLPEDDQALLMLHVTSRLTFPEIAAAFLKDDLDATEEELRRKGDCLRQQFQRIKRRLEKLARDDGLI
jgi:RNA polymerase sigma factor (sigma-70 family)